MPKRSRKDINVIASQIVEQVTNSNKNHAAVALGRLGGLKGGKSRAENLTNEQRREIASKAGRARWATSLYDEIKATQTAALLLELNGGSIDYAKCIKLLYSIEKEALNRWMRPVIYDDLYSMPHGQAVSQTMDRAEYKQRKAKSFWSDHIETSADNNLQLIKECGKEKLSRAEIELIKEIFELNRNKTTEQLFAEHHDAKLFPEWKDPHGSSIKTTYSDLLSHLGKTPNEIEEFEEHLTELAYLKKMSQ
jgi:hypothetical protein